MIPSSESGIKKILLSDKGTNYARRKEMWQVIFWFFASIGILVTFVAILVTIIWLFYKARSRALCIPLLQILHQREQQEPWGISEIAQVLEKRGQFPRYIPALFGLYKPEYLTADACHDALQAKFITDTGGLISHYKLSDKGYEVLNAVAANQKDRLTVHHSART